MHMLNYLSHLPSHLHTSYWLYYLFNGEIAQMKLQFNDYLLTQSKTPNICIIIIILMLRM